MAVFKGNLDIDPRGMIYEAYRIENISLEECRMIFLDWAMHTPQGDMQPHLQVLLTEYAAGNEDHPMTKVITDGLNSGATNGRRRGGRSARVNE